MYRTPSASPTPSSSPPAAAPDRPSRLGKFGILPRLAGTSFLVLGLFARLPLAMLTIGALTFVTSASGSYAAGGLAAGAVGVGSALGAPLLGHLADRRGQRIVLLTAAVLNTLAVVGLLLVVAAASSDDLAGDALPAVVAVSFAAGFTCPQIGPLARVRWMAMMRRRPASDLDTALSYESTADELTFVLGPALVGLLASLLAPWLPLALAAGLTLTLVSAFAVHRTVLHSDAGAAADAGPDTEHDGAPVDARRHAAALVVVPILGMVAMGTFFGSTQAFLTAFAGGFGAAESSGILYAVMGLSSAAAALSVAYWSQRLSHPVRWILSAAGMVLAAAALVLPGTIPVMLVVLFVLGVFVGPTMVTVFSIGSVVAPPGRLGTTMTLLASGLVAGTAIGSSTAGTLAEVAGVTGAATVPMVAAGALLALGAVSALALRRRTDR